jgi:hypothetical protein
MDSGTEIDARDGLLLTSKFIDQRWPWRELQSGRSTDCPSKVGTPRGDLDPALRSILQAAGRWAARSALVTL